MSKVVLLLTATSVGLGLVSLHLVKQLRDSDAAVTELKAQVAELEKQATRVTVPPVFSVMPAPPIAAVAVTQPRPSKDAPKTAAQASAGASQTPVSGHSREDAMRMMREHRERERLLMQDPEYRQAMRLQARNNLARQYPGVIEELGLNPKQAEEFFSMLADQQMRSQELMSPVWMGESGENLDPAAQQERYKRVQQSANEMYRNNEAELASRFGQDKLQAWKEYQSTSGMRYQLDHMRTTLAATGLPLNEELSKPMLKALAEAQKAEIEAYNTAAKQAGPWAPRLAASVGFENNNGEWQLEQAKKRNQRMLDAISSYLTYEQRTAIEKEQQAQLKMQEAQLRLMRERGDMNGNRAYTTSGSAQLIPLQ